MCRSGPLGGPEILTTICVYDGLFDLFCVRVEALGSRRCDKDIDILREEMALDTGHNEREMIYILWGRVQCRSRVRQLRCQ